MNFNLSRARATAIEAAEAAGGLVKDRLFRRFVVHEKGSKGDVVTDLDFASEKLIIKIIQERYPGHRIISEELGVQDNGASWTWLVDPIDGTNNLVIGLPVLTVGIALCQEDVPVVSAVHDPISCRTWSAISKQGAWGTEGFPIRRPKGRPRREPILAWIQGYGVGKDDRIAQMLKAVLARDTHRLLDLWAPLTCWMMLARGDIDGIVGYKIGELDLHAGALVATETGLSVHEFSGSPFAPRFRGTTEDQCVLAGSAEIVRKLAQQVTLAERLADKPGGLGGLRVPWRWSDSTAGVADVSR